jgi:hypothetical protein
MGKPPSFFFYTSNAIYADFNVSFETNYLTTLNQNNKILMVFPQYDIGVLPDESQVTCKIVSTFYK